MLFVLGSIYAYVIVIGWFIRTAVFDIHLIGIIKSVS